MGSAARTLSVTGVLFITLIFYVAAGVTAANSFELVTSEEHKEQKTKGGKSQPMPDPKPAPAPEAKSAPPGPPVIELVRPDLKLNPFASPIDLRIRFQPADGRKIDIESLKILYGFFALDITDRVLKHGEISPEGVAAPGAELPAGSHSITVQISDDAGLRGERDFSFTIK